MTQARAQPLRFVVVSAFYPQSPTICALSGLDGGRLRLIGRLQHYATLASPCAFPRSLRSLGWARARALSLRGRVSLRPSVCRHVRPKGLRWRQTSGLRLTHPLRFATLAQRPYSLASLARFAPALIIAHRQPIAQRARARALSLRGRVSLRLSVCRHLRPSGLRWRQTSGLRLTQPLRFAALALRPYHADCPYRARVPNL